MNGMTLLSTAAVALAFAGAAGAQPLDLSLHASTAPVATIPLAGAPAKAVPDLADPLDAQARPVLQTNALDTAVFAKTALDRKFSGNDRLSGSVGFLCGLQPGHADSGAGAAYGVDPHGRFVGAKFSIAFK
jgi:hypothetical protein